MTDFDLLKKVIDDSGMTITAIAEKGNILRETLYNRLNGKGEFKASEIYNIGKVLHLTNEKRDAIFFKD